MTDQQPKFLDRLRAAIRGKPEREPPTLDPRFRAGIWRTRNGGLAYLWKVNDADQYWPLTVVREHGNEIQLRGDGMQPSGEPHAGDLIEYVRSPEPAERAAYQRQADEFRRWSRTLARTSLWNQTAPIPLPLLTASG